MYGPGQQARLAQATRGRKQQHAAAARRRRAEQLSADLADIGERVGPGEAEAVRPGVMIDVPVRYVVRRGSG